MKKKKLIPLFIIVVLAIIFVVWKVAVPSTASYIEVDAGTVSEKDITRTINVTGTLEPLHEESIPVSSLRRIGSISANEGETVTAGQVLAVFDMQDLSLQKEKLLIAQEQINADLNEVKDPELFSKEATVLARLKQLEIDVQNANRKLAEAKDELTKNESLYKDEVISLQTLDASKAVYKDRLDQLSKSQSALQSARTDSSDLSVSSNKETDKLERQLAQNKLDISLVDEQIRNLTIISSISGTLVNFDISQGQYPKNGTIITIRDYSKFNVTLQLTQEDALKVALEQTAQINIDGINKTFTGKVSKIGRQADVDIGSGSRTPKVEVVLLLNSTDEKMAAGFDANVILETGKELNAVSVKREAIQYDDNGNPELFVIEGAQSGNTIQGTAKRVSIQTGIEDRSTVQVSQIETGTVIILTPPSNLKDGDLVKGDVE